MRKDVEGDWWKWLNNKKVTQLMDKGYKRNTKQKQLEYFKKIRDSNKDLLFAICLNNKKHIGCVGLHQINLGKRKAQFGIIIGNTRITIPDIASALAIGQSLFTKNSSQIIFPK